MVTYHRRVFADVFNHKWTHISSNILAILSPSISTGAYCYPREEAAIVSSEAIRSFLQEDNSIEEVRLVFFSESDARVFLRKQRFAV
jgi:O-acetyl-ADP-ribose deacetylase